MKGPPEDKLVVPAKGFDFGDVIAATTDPDHSDDVLTVKELRTKTGGEAGRDFDFFDYQERLKRLAGRPMVMQVLRVAKGPNDATTSSLVNVLVPPAYHVTLGMRMKMGEVAAIRDHSPASEKVQPGDKIVAAHMTTGGASLLDLPESKLDPVRLPYDLEQAADRAPVKAPVQVVLTVKRWDDHAHEQKDADVTLDWDDAWRFDEELPIGEASAMAVPELGVAYRVESTVVHVDEGSPAAKAGIQPNDRVEAIAFKKRDKNGPAKWDAWDEMKSDRSKPGGAVEYSYDQWAHYFYVMQTVELPDVKVRVVRGNAAPLELEMMLETDRTWPLEQRGLILLNDMTLQKADNLWQAVGMGAGRTWSFIRQLYLGFANILTGRISVRQARGRPAAAGPGHLRGGPGVEHADPVAGSHQREPGGGELPADPGAGRRAHGLSDLRADPPPAAVGRGAHRGQLCRAGGAGAAHAIRPLPGRHAHLVGPIAAGRRKEESMTQPTARPATNIQQGPNARAARPRRVASRARKRRRRA